MIVKLSDAVAALARKLGPGSPAVRAGIAAAAVSVRRAIEDFYRARPSRSGFWPRQVESGKVAITELTDTHAKISVDSRELAHKIRGGTVRPIPPRRALAIPLTEEARLAGYPSNRRIPGVFHPKGTRVLAVKSGDGIRALWALVASVTHRPDPSAAVPDAVLREAADNAMREAILRALKR